MLVTIDLKNGIRSDTFGNHRILLFISNVHKTSCFSFEAFRAVKLLSQIPTNLKCGYFNGSTFFIYICYMIIELVGCFHCILLQYTRTNALLAVVLSNAINNAHSCQQYFFDPLSGFPIANVSARSDFLSFFLSFQRQPFGTY